MSAAIGMALVGIYLGSESNIRWKMDTPGIWSATPTQDLTHLRCGPTASPPNIRRKGWKPNLTP